MTQEVLIQPSLLKKILVFTKFRLSFLVVLSALSGYLFAGGSDYLQITYLMIGGSFVTAASNGANQIWEKDIDKLIKEFKNSQDIRIRIYYVKAFFKQSTSYSRKKITS